MYTRKLINVGVLALALLMGVGAVMVHARQADDPPAAGPESMASVDMQRIYEASNGPDQLSRQAAVIENDAQKRIDSIMAVPMLDQQELQEYGGLVAKEQPTAAETARMKELKAASDLRSDELRTLTAKANLSPADQARLKTLNAQSRLLEKILPDLQTDLRIDVAARVDAVKRQLFAQLRSDVAKVAQEKKIAHVFDTNTLVYSATDITQAVVQRVSKRGGH